MLSNGEILTQLIAKGFEESVGPMGGEDPIVNGNELILYSQLPECGYRFNNDGSVECFYPDPDEMYESLINDCGEDEDIAKEMVDNPPKYESVLDLLEKSDDGWFMQFVFDHPVLYESIKHFVKYIEGDLLDDK